jgi:hypothetical protein
LRSRSISSRIAGSASCSAIVCGHLRADARGLLDLLRRGGQQRVDRAKLGRQVAGR